jgi:hypothetical protein
LGYTLRCISGASHPTMIRTVGRDVVASSAFAILRVGRSAGRRRVVSALHCNVHAGRDFS